MLHTTKPDWRKKLEYPHKLPQSFKEVTDYAKKLVGKTLIHRWEGWVFTILEVTRIMWPGNDKSYPPTDIRFKTKFYFGNQGEQEVERDGFDIPFLVVVALVEGGRGVNAIGDFEAAIVDIIPEVQADKDGFVTCPYCNGIHRHGGQGNGVASGHRQPDCGNQVGYIVVPFK